MISLQSMQYFAYILKSLKDNKYYYGHTQNLEERLARHNAGKVPSTKPRRPFVIHYFEILETKGDAFKREQFFKSIGGYQLLKSQSII
jgi:putative endonuclease